MTTETSLDDKITELITTLQGQRVMLGDKVVRLSLSTALKLSRMKAKDKEKHDRIVSGNKLLQEFSKEVGLNFHK